MGEEKPKTIHEETRDDVKLILKIINGNGKIGLAAKVNILWGISVFLAAGVILALIKAWM